MADIIFNIAGQSTTHTVTAENTGDVLETYKAIMAQDGSWPSDGQGGFTEPTSAQIAKWVGEVYLFRIMKRDVMAYRRRVQAAAQPAIPPLDSDVS